VVFSLPVENVCSHFLQDQSEEYGGDGGEEEVVHLEKCCELVGGARSVQYISPILHCMAGGCGRLADVDIPHNFASAKDDEEVSTDRGNNLLLCGERTLASDP
jgi:hypothetical protein